MWPELSTLPANPEISGRYRIIGDSDGNTANAYSVSKLQHHETANSFLGDKPIAAAKLTAGP
jgi:hypothetical protein